MEVRIVETDSALQVKGGQTRSEAIESTAETVFGAFVDTSTAMASALDPEGVRESPLASPRPHRIRLAHSAANPSQTGCARIRNAPHSRSSSTKKTAAFDFNLVDNAGNCCRRLRIEVRIPRPARRFSPSMDCHRRPDQAASSGVTTRHSRATDAPPIESDSRDREIHVRGRQPVSCVSENRYIGYCSIWATGPGAAMAFGQRPSAVNDVREKRPRPARHLRLGASTKNKPDTALYQTARSPSTVRWKHSTERSIRRTARQVAVQTRPRRSACNPASHRRTQRFLNATLPKASTWQITRRHIDEESIK